ncbi:MAG: fluoride exporter [Actinomycetota bacterium]|nr:fluoride exporter [Actinomycetota bacterium]
MIVFLVAAACGGVASVVRYLVTLAFGGRGVLPWAVFTVNVVGSAIGGVSMGLATTGIVSTSLQLVLIGGVAGGLTTFSTWSTESVQLILAGKWRTAGTNVVLNLIVGLAAATAGYLVSTALS